MDQVLRVAGHLLLIFSFTIYFRVQMEAPEKRRIYLDVFKDRFRWVIGAGIALLAASAALRSGWIEGLATGIIIPPYIQCLLWVTRKLVSHINSQTAKTQEDKP